MLPMQLAVVTFSTCIKKYTIGGWLRPLSLPTTTMPMTLVVTLLPYPLVPMYRRPPFGGAVTASNDAATLAASLVLKGRCYSNGCDRSKVFTFSVTVCGFTSTCTRTFTWKVESLPRFDNCTTGLIDLGLQPCCLTNLRCQCNLYQWMWRPQLFAMAGMITKMVVIDSKYSPMRLLAYVVLIPAPEHMFGRKLHR